MRQEAVYIVDVFSEIVAAVAVKLAIPVYYMHGHPLEVVNRLTEMTKFGTTEGKKYPLVALFQDFDEQKGDEVDQYTVTKLHLIIANQTRNGYNATERYTKNFKPVLYPVYDELLYQIMRHKDTIVQDERLIKHTKTDRLYWGKNGLFGNDGNIFNDYIDCIELTDLQLTIKNKACTTGGRMN
jgi:hypothetical protein